MAYKRTGNSLVSNQFDSETTPTNIQHEGIVSSTHLIQLDISHSVFSVGVVQSRIFFCKCAVFTHSYNPLSFVHITATAKISYLLRSVCIPEVSIDHAQYFTAYCFLLHPFRNRYSRRVEKENMKMDT